MFQLFQEFIGLPVFIHIDEMQAMSSWDSSTSDSVWKLLEMCYSSKVTFYLSGTMFNLHQPTNMGHNKYPIVNSLQLEPLTVDRIPCIYLVFSI